MTHALPPAIRTAACRLAALGLLAAALPAAAQEAPPDAPGPQQEQPRQEPPAPGEIPAPSQPAPGEDDPGAAVLPAPEDAKVIISGEPLTTGTQPADTATTTPVPVNPGMDGDAPSEGLPEPEFEELPEGVEPPDGTIGEGEDAPDTDLPVDGEVQPPVTDEQAAPPPSRREAPPRPPGN